MAFNFALKLAIIESRKSQTVIAEKAGLHDSRLSRIIHGHQPAATEDEQKALARVLRKPIDHLFPDDKSASTSSRREANA